MKVLADGLLPCLPYMRPSWASHVRGEGAAKHSKPNASVMVLGNVFEDLGGDGEGALCSPAEMVVFVSEVDEKRQRLKLSLQPKLSFQELRVGTEYAGIVVDSARQTTLGLFVALSDDLVGLLHRSQFGAGEFADSADRDAWSSKRAVYRVGDRVQVWVLRKEVCGQAEVGAATGSKKKLKIDLTMNPGAPEMRQHQLSRFLQVLDEDAPRRPVADAASPAGAAWTAMDTQIRKTYDEADRHLLVKNSHLVREAEQCYPTLVIDYTTDPPPPPPPPEAKEKPFDFSLIDGWTAGKIAEEHKRISEKKRVYDMTDKTQRANSSKALSKAEEKLLKVLQKKVEDWGIEYYARIQKKLEEHEKRKKEIYDKIKEERDKYPHKSIIDLEKFRELAAQVKTRQYDGRCCFVTRLSYKEDVLGVGLEVRPEPETGRNIFHCSFDLLSKEGFHDFGVRAGVWKDRIHFWLPAAIEASHFRRALPLLADCFRQLGDGHVEKLTRSYGTQAGSAQYNLRAQLREAERTGRKLMSLDDYRKEQAERKMRAAKPSPPSSDAGEDNGYPPAAAISAGSALGLTQEDVAYGLEVLPKLMNLQTVQLMKGDLHISAKALEGYMGFHHLLLSILRQFPGLQTRVEQKIGTFLRDEAGRNKSACPNIGEFLCLLAVSRRYTWDDVSRAVVKETLERNASWAIDKFAILAKPGIGAEVRLEKTFKASIVSIRLLCFNVWFLRNIVFKRYGEESTVQSIVAEKRAVGPLPNLVDRRWEEYEERRGVPRLSEIDLLQEEMRKIVHGDGLNSWADYFTKLNLKPLKATELSQLLRMSLNDAVEKGYIPLWKLRPRLPKAKTSAKNDYMGADVDKYDAMFTTSGSNKW